MKIIVIISSKSGMRDTTSALKMRWMLANKGKKLLLDDNVSQCALSYIVAL